jgi:hypothetical protein
MLEGGAGDAQAPNRCPGAIHRAGGALADHRGHGKVIPRAKLEALAAGALGAHLTVNNQIEGRGRLARRLQDHGAGGVVADLAVLAEMPLQGPWQAVEGRMGLKECAHHRCIGVGRVVGHRCLPADCLTAGVSVPRQTGVGVAYTGRKRGGGSIHGC